jgi:hypothetical protein
MNITLKSPNVNIGSTNQLVSKAALEAMYPSANNNFTLKITLGTPPPQYSISPISAGQSSVVLRIDDVMYTDLLDAAAYRANVGKTIEFIYNTATKAIVDVNFAQGLYADGIFADLATDPNALVLDTAYSNMEAAAHLTSPSNKKFLPFFYSNSATVLGGAVGISTGMKFNYEYVAGGVFGALYTSVTIVARGSA